MNCRNHNHMIKISFNWRDLILGVRELFEQEPPPPPRKTRAEMMKDIDADYYGYMDDDDGILIPLEQKAEKECKIKYCFNCTKSNIHIL